MGGRQRTTLFMDTGKKAKEEEETKAKGKSKGRKGRRR